MTTNQTAPTYGVIFHPKFPPETLADYARRAEQAGFDELWLWDDCFTPGAFTSAAIALSATHQLKVGIGLMPATVYNPLFAAMEITTLACAFPGRFLPGFGHGLASWMTQIGAAPKSSMKTLEKTVDVVRRLLKGEMVTTHGDDVDLEQVQMSTTPKVLPPLFIGAMRQKSLQLAGRMGDGTILTAMSTAEYVRWARAHIQKGLDETSRSEHRVVAYFDVKVNNNRDAARAAVRHTLASRYPWFNEQVSALNPEVDAFIQTYGTEALAEQMPDTWVDALSASGTPDEALASIRRLVDAGADSIIFQPLDGDPECLDEYARYLMPRLKK